MYHAQASQALSVYQSQRRNWVKAFADDPQHALPGQGRMKHEHEIARLEREGIKLKAETRHPKKAAVYFAKEAT